MELQQLLQTSKDILQEKESAHAEQVTDWQSTDNTWPLKMFSQITCQLYVFCFSAAETAGSGV